VPGLGPHVVLEGGLRREQERVAGKMHPAVARAPRSLYAAARMSRQVMSEARG
jgi:hypothetical protein